MKIALFAVLALLAVSGFVSATGEPKTSKHHAIPFGGFLENLFTDAAKNSSSFDQVMKMALRNLPMKFAEALKTRTKRSSRVVDLPDPLRYEWAPFYMTFPYLRTIWDFPYLEGDVVSIFGNYDDMYMSGHSRLAAAVFDRGDYVTFEITIPEFHITGQRHDLTAGYYDLREYMDYLGTAIICAIFPGWCPGDPVWPSGPEIDSRGAYSFYLRNVTLLGTAQYGHFEAEDGSAPEDPILFLKSCRAMIGDLSIWSEHMAYNGAIVPNPDWNAYSQELIRVVNEYVEKAFLHDRTMAYVAGAYLQWHVDGEIDLIDWFFTLIELILGVYDYIPSPTTTLSPNV